MSSLNSRTKKAERVVHSSEPSNEAGHDFNNKEREGPKNVSRRGLLTPQVFVEVNSVSHSDFGETTVNGSEERVK
ncbi:hypothetical protein VNI00_007730 [Paramarasmius palmivorus]|uniref:Uncharacterized protein n=1 Tax=Paramarasmius palmivorus TaxID=297713 RepID=A0AAW0D661_9AGAR